MTVSTNNVGSGNIDLTPTGIKYKEVVVSGETFRRFQPGRVKYARWKNYIDPTCESEQSMVKFLHKNPDGIVVLKCADTGALRAIRQRSREG